MMVSIIIPCYNSQYCIIQAIESVVQQSYSDWELLVVDDCSSDTSANIIHQFMQTDERIRYLKTERPSGSQQFPEI